MREDISFIGLICLSRNASANSWRRELSCVTINMSLMLWLKLDIVADVLWPDQVTGVIFSIVLLGHITKPQTDGVVISFAVYNGA